MYQQKLNAWLLGLARFLKRPLFRPLAFFLVPYIAFGAYLAFSQEQIVYQPYPQDFVSCAEFSSAEKINYQGTRMYFKDNGPRLVVLYHGNAGSACDRIYLAELFEQAGYSYLLPEYAGYSNDIAKPSHELIKKDVQNVVAFLGERNFAEVVVVGESLGSSFASYHTSLAPPHKLLLITSFTNLTDIARSEFWFYPVSFLVKDLFDNAHLLTDFRGSVLLLHGEKDNIIPLKLGQKLFTELVVSRKEIIIIPDAGHNDLFWFSETAQAIRDFLK